MPDKCKYNMHGWMVWYDAANGFKEVIPVQPGIYAYDDFLQVAGTDIAAATAWEVTANGGTAAVAAGESAGEHGVARITCAAVDNSAPVMYLPQPLYPAYDPCCECRVRINEVTASKFAFGFADAAAVAADANLGTYVAGTPAVGGSDGALFVWDNDATTDYLYYMTQLNTAAEQGGTAYAGALVLDTSYYLRVMLQDNGTTTQAYFYFDGTLVGSVTAAVTRTVALYPAITVSNTDGGANHIEVDYMRVWARRV